MALMRGLLLVRCELEQEYPAGERGTRDVACDSGAVVTSSRTVTD
jgi:hypothetical protein